MIKKKNIHKKDPVLCDFNEIHMKVPRYRVIKLLFKRTYLDADEAIFLKALHWQAEAAENKIRHVKSIIEKCLLKCASSRP